MLCYSAPYYTTLQYTLLYYFGWHYTVCILCYAMLCYATTHHSTILYYIKCCSILYKKYFGIKVKTKKFFPIITGKLCSLQLYAAAVKMTYSTNN